MKKLYGRIDGIKISALKEIENLYKEKIHVDEIVSVDIAKQISKLSALIKRQIGLLIDRNGNIEFIIIGTNQQIMIPDLSGYRGSKGRLRGLRCVHTHLKKDERLSEDDLTDLALLRLDLMCAITIDSEGEPSGVYTAHIIPDENAKPPYSISKKGGVDILSNNCSSLISSIESELAKKNKKASKEKKSELAILISVTSKNKYDANRSIEELADLAKTADVEILDKIYQHRKKPDPKTLMGKGKINEIAIKALHKGATMLIFDQELNPSQISALSDSMEIKVIDRTQLILDVFASRAQTKEGKIQVALAQQKYLLPRLIVQKSSAFSRLAGGIGGRGPGETKLEVDRRRARDHINKLEKELKKVQKNRARQRAKREKNNIPVISIVGYTNAGKSTLLNTLTQSRVVSEDKLFATLDPTSRRLRFPREREVIITDTVGFIQDLPKDLKVAFRATLEELESADILLHVVDISNPSYENHIESVNNILEELKLDNIPQVLALNKADLLDIENVSHIEQNLNGVRICAKKRDSLKSLYDILDKKIDILS